MTGPERIGDGEGGVAEEAAAWFVRLQSDVATEADFLAFEGWIAEPSHRVAYDRLEALDAEIAASRAPIWRAMAAEEVARSALERPRRPVIGRRVMAFGSLAAAAAAAAFFIAPRAEAPSWTAYTAAKGHPREIALADGTKITLNGGGALRVALGEKQRHVVLQNAEAAFDVAHEASRPFVVDVGDRRVVVLGTEFNILQDHGRLTVTVRRGVVAVRPWTGGEGDRVAAGHQLVHQEGQSASALRAVKADAAFAWRNGQLIYEDARLADVVGDLNRYFPTPIRLEGETTNDLRFSGALTLDAEDQVVRRLEAFLPVEAGQASGEIVLRERPAQP